MTDSLVWDWLFGLCPSAKENGGNPERWSCRERGQREGGGGEDQLGCHSCEEVLVTFKPWSPRGRDVMASTRPCCFICIGLKMSEHVVLLVP